MRIVGHTLTTVNVLYYLPDYNSIINEFIWQTYDVPPEFFRIHKFLNYWHQNVEAVIKEVQLGYTDPYNPSKYNIIENLLEI